MKKLSKIKLQSAVVLDNQEMKMIFGGSGSGGSGVCAYSTTYTGSAVCLLNGGAQGAEFMAGSGGWWCCGCDEAIRACRG